MNIKTQDIDKQEVLRKLRLAKDIIGKIIDQMENGLNWEVSHAQLIVAITQLRSVTRQLAVHHLVVCIANRLKKQQNQQESQTNINEFIKTFNYIH